MTLLIILSINIVLAGLVYHYLGTEGYLGFLFGCVSFWIFIGVTLYGANPHHSVGLRML